MKRFLFLLLVCTLFFSSLSAPFVAGATTDADIEAKLMEQKIYLESVDNFISYLEELSINDSKAEASLEQFLDLENKQQAAFIEVLKQPKIMFELLEFEGNAESVVIVDNIEIPITKETEINSVILNSGEKEVTAEDGLYVFGVQLGSVESTVLFEHDGTSATTILDGHGDHWNVNPACVFVYQGSNQYISSDMAHNRAKWTIYATGSLGFWSNSLNYYVRANASAQWKKSDSTLSNLNFSWTRFFD